MSADSPVSRAYYLFGILGFSFSFLTWLGSRMEGWSFFAAALYVVLFGAYLLVRWNFGPWSTTFAQSKLTQSQVRALTAAHFSVLGALLFMILMLISANEIGRWMPDFTERQILSDNESMGSSKDMIRAALVDLPSIKDKVGVVGVAKSQGDASLLILRPFIESTSVAILKKLTDFALSLIAIPLIGIPALKLFELLFAER